MVGDGVGEHSLSLFADEEMLNLKAIRNSFRLSMDGYGLSALLDRSQGVIAIVGPALWDCRQKDRSTLAREKAVISISAHNQVVWPSRSGCERRPEFGPCEAEVGRRFVRRLQNLLDAPARNSELLDRRTEASGSPPP